MSEEFNIILYIKSIWFPREAEKPEYFSNVTHVGVQDEGLEGTQRHKYAGSDSSDRECQLSLETDHLPH